MSDILVDQERLSKREEDKRAEVQRKQEEEKKVEAQRKEEQEKAEALRKQE